MNRVVQGMSDIADEEGCFLLLVEAQEVAHGEVAGCQQRHGDVVAGGAPACCLAPFGIHLLGQINQIQVVPVVAAALHHGFRGIPRQERQRVQGFHILRVFLFDERLGILHARGRIIAEELHEVLVTVEFEDKELAAVGSP